MTKSVHNIIERSVFITYISNIILGWLIEYKYIVDTIITYNVWTVVQLFDF